MNNEYSEKEEAGLNSALLVEQSSLPTTIGCYLKGSKRMYTYRCQRPVGVGDKINVKLPGGTIVTETVEIVHDTPQFSDKWETKWAVVVMTAAQYKESLLQGSELGKELGL